MSNVRYTDETMSTSPPPIPWQPPSDWLEVLFFFNTMEKVHGHTLEPVRTFAGKIQLLLAGLSSPMDTLCSVICPHCRDVCCTRATVWYDFKDLIGLYFGGKFPDSQIRKIPGPITPVCVNLTETGCCLPRIQRPFVCTWYLCPDQKRLCQNPVIPEKIEIIKHLRYQMEDSFCAITAGSLRFPHRENLVFENGHLH